MTKKAVRQSGFTLLEILIATGILAIGLVTVFSLFPIGIYAVKDAVERTRATSLALTTRSELASMRAGMRILDSGAQHYGDGYVPFGPWQYPGKLDTFRAPLYEYYDGGALHRRIVFDERSMVPVTLTGTFNGTDVVNVQAAGLTRDSDRLEYYYAHPAPAGLNMYAPYDIYLKVQGQVLQIYDRTYSSGAIYTAGANLATLTLAAPTVASGTNPYSFDILLPVALREPVVDVPQEWAGGVGDFTAGPPYALVPGPYVTTRNLIKYLAVPGSGNPTSAWISIPALGGDWFEVTDINRDAVTHIPQSIDVAGSPAGNVGGDEFKICLPLAEYATDPVTFDPNTFNIAVDSVDPSLNLLGGGGPQTSHLGTGAQIEILLDGAVATFSSVPPNTFRTTVSITGALNGNTKALIKGLLDNGGAPPFVNFIRVDGRDYEIADTSLMDASFEVFGSVPVPSAGARYFNIVLGYVPGQVPEVARFPVRSVTPETRPEGGTYAYPVKTFTILRDANGNWPNVLGFTVGRVNPIHVLPRNHSQFASEVVLSQKSSVGIVWNDGGVPVIDGPVYDPPQLGPPPQAYRIPYTSDIYQAVAQQVTHAYEVRALYPPTLAGTLPFAELADITSVPADTPPADHTRLGLASALPGLPLTPGLVPVHILDKNQFFFAGPELLVGQANFNGTDRFDFTASPSPAEAIFVAGDATVYMLVNLTDGTNIATEQQVTFVDGSMQWFRVAGPLPAFTNPVTVSITPASLTLGVTTRPLGRGIFTQGSTVVQSYYDPTVAPGKGFPSLGTERYCLAVGDWIEQPLGLGGAYYAVKAIQKETATERACIILDRPYEGATNADAYFHYATPIEEGFEAQATVFRRYRIQALLDASAPPSRAQAAAFGFGIGPTRDPDGQAIHVLLVNPLPAAIKPGDYIRADGDADHAEGGNVDRGMGDQIDGDWRWYMIDAVSADRRTLTLTSTYRGYVPATETEARQPASVTSSIVRTFDTVIGAF